MRAHRGWAEMGVGDATWDSNCLHIINCFNSNASTPCKRAHALGECVGPKLWKCAHRILIARFLSLYVYACKPRGNTNILETCPTLFTKIEDITAKFATSDTDVNSYPTPCELAQDVEQFFINNTPSCKHEEFLNVNLDGPVLWRQERCIEGRKHIAIAVCMEDKIRYCLKIDRNLELIISIMEDFFRDLCKKGVQASLDFCPSLITNLKDLKVDTASNSTFCELKETLLYIFNKNVEVCNHRNHLMNVISKLKLLKEAVDCKEESKNATARFAS
ncbi:hypothetical protein PoB_003468000 [Plakobranchus ocellatus]|uniref:Uncharacterized protein n=1 Tax=Plakobranchus ocellatus TaxID=259542 RepID=A0AAV4AMP9_9GAST|nr:hypothetical protein PoB_003468000 [Plakobranchus ocellatus]